MHIHGDMAFSSPSQYCMQGPHAGALMVCACMDGGPVMNCLECASACTPRVALHDCKVLYFLRLTKLLLDVGSHTTHAWILPSANTVSADLAQLSTRRHADNKHACMHACMSTPVLDRICGPDPAWCRSLPALTCRWTSRLSSLSVQCVAVH